MGRRPLWYYGILCLIGATLPTMIAPLPVDATVDAKASRLAIQLVMSAIGFALIGWHVVRTRRQNRIK